MKFCTNCNSTIEIHADGTAMCGCSSVDYDAEKTARQLKSEMPTTWEEQDTVARKMKENYEYTD